MSAVERLNSDSGSGVDVLLLGSYMVTPAGRGVRMMKMCWGMFSRYKKMDKERIGTKDPG